MSSVKEQIHAELDRMSEDELDRLLPLVRGLAERTRTVSSEASDAPRRRGLLSRLAEVRLQGPEDFSENLEQYLSGDKRLGEPADVR